MITGDQELCFSSERTGQNGVVVGVIRYKTLALLWADHVGTL